MAWGKAGSTTLSSAGDNIEVTGMTASKVISIMFHNIRTGGEIIDNVTFNNDTGSNYAYRKSNSGGSDGTHINKTEFDMNVVGQEDEFAIGYIVNVSSEEKLFIGHACGRRASGATTAPDRAEEVGKWVNTSAQITTVDVTNTLSGSYDTDSNLSVLGSDITGAAAIPVLGTNLQNNSLFVEKDTARRYWSSGYIPANTATYETDFSTDPTISSNDTGNNYYDSTNDRWHIQWDWDNTNDAGSIDLYSKIGNQNLSDSNWVIRFKYTIVSQNFTTGSDSKQFFVGLTSTDYSNAFWYPDSSNVSTNFGLYMDKSGTYQLYTNNNSTYSGGTFTNTSRSISNETLYVELIRENSTTAKMNLYSDSTYSTLLVGVSLTIPSGLTGLRYLSVKGMRYSSSGTITSNMDDLEIYNGVANADAVPATWLLGKSHVSKSGCLAYYNFEQTSGNLINQATTANGFTDGLGSTGDGVNSGATQTATGKLDNAWSFDGTNDQVDSSSSSDLILTGDMTWAGWVNINTTTSSKVITVASIRGDAGSNTEADNCLFSFFIVQNSSPPTLRAFHENGAGTNNQVDFTTSLSEDTWYHIVFTRDVSEKTVKCYIDGSLHGSGTYSNNPTTTTSTLPLRTGGNNFSGAANSDGHFNGLLDEVSVWNRILTADEISRLYNSGHGAII